MSGRIGIGVGLALLIGFGVFAALPRALPNAPAAGGAASSDDGEARARVDVCLAAQRDVAQQRVARGGPAPAGQPSDAAVVARACAPLFRDAGCRQAQLDYDVPAIEARASTMLQACVRGYCPTLPAPRPAACERVPADAMETFTAWNELRAAILRRDIGEAEAARAFPER